MPLEYETDSKPVRFSRKSLRYIERAFEMVNRPYMVRRRRGYDVYDPTEVSYTTKFQAAFRGRGSKARAQKCIDRILRRRLRNAAQKGKL